MKFFDYRQNNSFGVHEGYKYVIVEASSPQDADERVLASSEVDVYFNGCRDGKDCPCCGDRWSRQWPDASGSTEPSVWSESVVVEDDDYGNKTFAIILFANGTVKFSSKYQD